VFKIYLTGFRVFPAGHGIHFVGAGMDWISCTTVKSLFSVNYRLLQCKHDASGERGVE
jgi:hypothetical protein